MNDVILAADLGGTNLRLAAIDSSGKIIHISRRVTPKGVTPDGLISLVAEMESECKGVLSSGTEVIGISFASPAPAAKDTSVLSKLPNLPSLNGMNLRSALADRFHLPVTLENDATAAAIGESWIGASAGVADSILVTLGTGIGGGIILNNEPLRGLDGTGGEIGHICVEPDGHPCGCGSHGCVEQYASATAIVRMAREAGLEVSSSLEVYDAAMSGDEPARAVFNKMARYLGIALAGLINAVNPEMIVIAGGVAAGWQAFIGPLGDEIRLRAFSGPAKRAEIVRSVLGDTSGILGAARSGFLNLNDRR